MRFGVRITAVGVALLAPLLPGCRNVGVVYGEYQQFSLASFRVTPEEASPLSVNIGWNQGNLAIVSKKGKGAQSGEAVAMIAKTELGSGHDLTGNSNGNLLAADSYFISGNAAVVASLPDGKQVVLKSGATETVDGIEIEGTPAERIGSAFNLQVEEVDEIRGRVEVLQGQVDEILMVLSEAQLERARIALAQTSMIDEGDSWDASATEVQKRRWLRTSSRGGDELVDVEDLNSFLAGLRQIQQEG